MPSARGNLLLWPANPTKIILLELGGLSLEGRWQQGALHFWNRLVAHPEDDLYQDVLFDSVVNRTGSALGVQRS